MSEVANAFATLVNDAPGAVRARLSPEQVIQVATIVHGSGAYNPAGLIALIAQMQISLKGKPLGCRMGCAEDKELRLALTCDSAALDGLWPLMIRMLGLAKAHYQLDPWDGIHLRWPHDPATPQPIEDPDREWPEPSDDLSDED